MSGAGETQSAPGEQTPASAQEGPSRAEAALRSARVSYVVPPIVQGAGSLEEFAQKSGLRPAQILKSLLLNVDGTRYAMLLVPGDRSADFAALRKFFAARSVRLADREQVERITGYHIGTVTPLGMQTGGLPILLDAAALDEPLVSLGTGRPGRHVRLAPADLLRALGAEAGPFGRPGTA